MMISQNRKLAAEFIGTFMLVFAGCGAVVVDTLTGGAISHVGVALTFGLVIMVMIYAVGHISGAHFNPAVTIAFTAVRHFPVKSAAGYIAAQIAGAICAAFLLRLLFGEVANLGATLPNPEIAMVVDMPAEFLVIVVELVISFALMFVIMAVATDTRAIGELAGVAIGSTVALISLFAGPVTGSSMNPARSIGPALVSGEMSLLFIYIAAPIAGTLIGAFAYRAICGCGEDGVPPC